MQPTRRGRLSTQHPDNEDRKHGGDRNIHAYLGDTDALTLSTAQRIAQEIRAEQAALDKEYVESFEAQEKAVEDQLVAAQRRGAERRPRVLRGVQVSLPGDETDWSDS